MKWTWDKFGFDESHPNPIERLQDVLREHLPEELFGTVWVAAMSREPGYVMLFAVETSLGDATEPISLAPETIKQIQREYGVKALHVIRWSDDPGTLIRNALHATEVGEVLLCDMIGRAVVLVQDDQLSLAIGPRGQNVRLASKLCGWDIDVMTADELKSQMRRAISGFCELERMDEECAGKLVEQGFLSYEDLSVIEPDALIRIGKLSAAQAATIVEQAEAKTENDQR